MLLKIAELDQTQCSQAKRESGQAAWELAVSAALKVYMDLFQSLGTGNNWLKFTEIVGF